MAVSLAVVDTGPLYAAIDASDQNHGRAAKALQDSALRLVIPIMVVAETTYLVGTRLGPRPEARFLAALDELDIIAPAADGWKRIAELVERYKTFPLGGVDASVIALAERLDTDLVLSFDHRHMATVKPSHCAALRLLP